jgi:cellulose synthase/poly-beta-1,6-N-acetylglucosamine synthase-like glycosyltransferase
MPTRVTYVVTPCEIGIVILMTFYNFLMMENPWYVSLFNGSQVKAQPDNLEFKDELEAKEELCMIDVLVVCYKEDQSTLINTFRACSKMLKPKTVHQVG